MIKISMRQLIGAVVFIMADPDDGRGAVDRDGAAEEVVRRAVGGEELEELIAKVGIGRNGAQDHC